MSIAAYRDRTSGQYPLMDIDLRLRFDGGLPAVFGAEEFDLLAADPVAIVPQPDYTAEQTIREGKPIQVGGGWRQFWIVENLPPALIVVPEEITDRQFAEQLAFDGEITRDEAEEWAGAGVIPARLAAAVDAIPNDDVRFVARMHLRGATRFLRNNVFTLTLGAILGWDPVEIDRIWREAAVR